MNKTALVYRKNVGFSLSSIETRTGIFYMYVTNVSFLCRMSAKLTRSASMPEIYFCETTSEDLAEMNLLRMEKYRRGTFHPRTVLTDILAQNGFYSTGLEAKCIFCMGVVDMGKPWSPRDHRRYFQHCPFVRGYPAGNIPIIRAPGSVLFGPYQSMPLHLVQALEYEPAEMRLLSVGMPALYSFDAVTDDEDA